MRRLREKLHSESGASILLALLLFLLCCMVAVSILAAAASNAGKIRSNRAEQQKYLTLSSAIQLIADEIQLVKYEWSYTVYVWEQDEAGSTKKYFFCKQNVGKYKDSDIDPDDDPDGDLLEQIPLKKWLDGETREKFFLNNPGFEPLDELNVIPPPSPVDTISCDLQVTLPGDLPGYPYQDSVDPDDPYASSDPMAVYQAQKEVNVRVELSYITHHIQLTAWFGEEDDPPDDGIDTMVAELVVENGNALELNETILVGCEPGGTEANPVPETGKEKYEKSKIMTWKLNWIRKGGL